MVRSSDPLTEDEIWGTLEELLLACSVNRHGTHSWDSVATEVRSRSPFAYLLTADTCKQRYRLLKRRFSGGGGGGGGGDGDGVKGGDEIEEGGPTVEIPWLDELRKLRVAELRREVQRYDVSIGSLQLKVKKLKEERERSLREADDAGDGVNGSGSDPKEKNDQKDRPESARSMPDIAAGDRISGDYSGRSCKESNSTEPKVEEVKVEEWIKEEADPAVTGSRSGSGSRPVAFTTASYNGSSDTIAKGAARSPAVEPNQAVNESGESVAESKGGEEEEGTKESSDVQSSASLSRRRRRVRRRRATASSAEPEAEAVSPVRKAVDAESQLLIAFLETIRSKKDGSVFDRRLESQENVRYRNLIRRHVDLEIVRNRIVRNGYTRTEFFRDLLLLCNNALVFYPKTSPESISAVHLRNLINKEIAATLRKTPQPSPQSAKERTPPPAAAAPAQQPLPPLPSKPKSDPDRANAPREKPDSLPPLVACRKRSSFLSKPAKNAKKIEKVEKEENKEKKEIEEEEENEELEEEKEQASDKKNTKQRSAVSRGLRTNKARGNSKGGGRGGGGGAVKSSNLVSTPKPDPAEQEMKSGVSTAKKRSAADFLNRMKSSSPSSNGKLVEKSSLSSRRGGEPQKKKTREESKKDSAATTAATVKRSVGRPPKRVAEMPAPPAKRAREEKTPPLPKKRGRR